ncbi:alkane hydroxylase mah1 [Phtheirospermum japonicum]|uniref:Alkane hydroxylase mah1 n=1 Tax=Phtheirospermum japonicum TaxID=374723 RepID=A0A830BYR7_9LAMI|nr:alkane hydroxylase mah1 [Phtheirospermum japonicum]
MLPTLLLHVEQIHDRCTEIFAKSQRGTFHFHGPWFSNMDMLGTVDPENVHYIMTGNFQNFPKGPIFKEIFDVLGDGIFNADSESWRDQRKLARFLITHQRFYRFLGKTSHRKLENGLVPVLEMISRENQVVDLQDLFQRFTFDTTCILVTGYDPGCLSVSFPDVPFSKAMDDAEESIFMRHVVPEWLWKLMRWLGIGGERKLSEAWKVLDSVINGYIAMKREEMRKGGGDVGSMEREGVDGSDLLTCYMNSFLRDTILNLMIAGRDTTSSALTWFMWLVSSKPEVEEKIRDELKMSILPLREGEKWRIFSVDEVKNLVYLHGAICEALRLYPPVPFQHKEPLQADILPSGHFVNPKMKVMFSLYAMGRMESIWGKDRLEFKPERWITKGGSIKHEPSYKFLAFNAGPRTCLGKEVALTQMKAVAATLIHNYQVRVAEGHRVVPNCSIILYMKNGLKVRVANRWSCE